MPGFGGPGHGPGGFGHGPRGGFGGPRGGFDRGPHGDFGWGHRPPMRPMFHRRRRWYGGCPGCLCWVLMPVLVIAALVALIIIL